MTTRGGLQAAKIIECEEYGAEDSPKIRKKGGNPIAVDCSFNPYEYTVQQSNQYEFKFKDGAKVPRMEFKGAGEKSLKLKLVFDLYSDENASDKDVSKITRKLWQLMAVNKEGEEKGAPPPVVFEWGSFQFYAVIKSVTQKFTLFLTDGTPVRSEVDISLSQHLDTDEYEPQNPTSGGGPLERVWLVRGGDRLDVIAAEVYGDSQKWRVIAEHNDIVNPLRLRSGQHLRIPPA